MKKMKILRVTAIAFIVALVSIMLATTVHAAPLRNVPLDVEQPDGTALELFASGDSSFNYVHDSEGRVIMQHPRTGFWVYADLDEDGLLVATDQVVADDGYFYFSHQRASSSSPMGSRGITTADIDFTINDHLIREREEVIFPELESLSVGIESTVGVVRQNPIEGHIENIIIMIAFADQDPVIPNTLRERVNYTFNTSSRSLSNAIYTLSDGLATINSTFLGANNGTILMYHHHRARRYYLPHHPVTNPYGYQSRDSVERRVALLGSAARAVENHPLLQGRTLDTMVPGRVDSVTFIVRGNPAGWGSILWPHVAGLNDGSTLNGATINAYSLLLEGNASEHHRIEESVIIHEQLHILGFPDLYRYHHYGNPVGIWDIMATDRRLASPNTHTLQRYAGWGTTPTEITRGGTFTLSPLGTPNAPHPTAYVLSLSGNQAGEFILLEYRSARNGTMFDPYAGVQGGVGEGIIISRINRSFRGNAQSRYPNFHDEVYIFRPGTTERNVATANIGNAPLSANSGRTSFGSASGTGYTNVIYRHDGSNTGIVISNVSSAGNTITFNVSINTRLVTFNPQGGTWSAPGSGTGNLTRPMIQSATNYATVMNTNNTALINPAQVAPTRIGYTFAGWFPTATGGNRVNHNTAVTLGAGAITLHARWTPTNATRTVTFNPQGGTWTAPGSGIGNLTRTMLQSATNYGAIMNTNNTALLNPTQVAPIRVGYTFAGWFTAATGGIQVNHNTAVTPGAGAITLHARWTATNATRTVTFNPQGGMWSAPGSGTGNLTRTMLQTATNYATVMNTNNTALLNPAQVAPTRAGYTFAGWSTAAIGGVYVRHNTTLVPGTTGITLHAQWTPLPTRTITFNPQGGTWSAPGSGTGNLTRRMLQTVTNYATVMNTNNTALLNPAQVAPTRVGYTFAGWFPVAAGGLQVNHNTPVTPGAGAITLHARWTPTNATRTVTFNPQGGTWSAPGSGTGNLTRSMLQSATTYATVMNTNNAALLNPAQIAPTRVGYTFAGWFTAATGGAQVNHNTLVTQGAGAITLHARWTPARAAVMNYTVPLRSGPNATYTSLGNATQGTRIAVVGTSGIWSNIQVGDRIGWVQSHRHSQLIENAEPHIAVMNYTIPLRGGPNATYTSLGNATQGTRVTVFGTSVDGVWTHIQMGTRAGWVMSHRHSQLIENAEPHIAVMNYTIPLRGGPNATYASLGNATLGARVTVFGTSVDGVWTHIQMGTRAGWVMSHRHNRLVGVMNHTVPLRSGPNATYASLGDIVQGTRVTAIGISADGIWTQIQAGARVGWTQNHRQSPVILNEGGPYQSTMNHTVPLRSGPDGTYASLGDATLGTSVTVHGTSLDGIWLNIQAGDRVGWVRHDRVN